MKKQFICSLFLALFWSMSFEASAATYPTPTANFSIPETTDSAFFGNKPTAGKFIDGWSFKIEPSATGNTGASISITNIFGNNIQNIVGLGAAVYEKDTGVKYDFKVTTVLNEGLSVVSAVLNNLPTGSFILEVFGNNVAQGSYGADFNISLDRPVTNPNVGAVPVPGAVWLFGSALAGLIGMSGRSQKGNSNRSVTA